MFNPKTEKIKMIAEAEKDRMSELEILLSGSVNMYIDYANILPWKEVLGFSIDLKRLKQFLDSFDNVKVNRIYSGTLIGEKKSSAVIKQMQALRFVVATKPVKIITYRIDLSSVGDIHSTILIKNLLKRPYLRALSKEGIVANNEEMRKLNQQNIFVLEDKKCNFDVEMGRDLLHDFLIDPVDTYVVWTSDSDFEEPLRQLLRDGKKVILFSTAGKPARELNELKKLGLLIFDIRKIREFICWNRELTDKNKSKRDPLRDPQATV